MNDKTIEKEWPICMSAGGDNMVFVPCGVVGHQKAYAACLHIAELAKVDCENSLYQSCFEAIDRRKCPAQKMRAEEKEAGRALYYKPRPGVEMGPSQHKPSPGYARGWNTVGGALDNLPEVSRPSRPKPEGRKKTSESGEEVSYGGYADAINKAVAEAKSTGKPVVTATQKPEQPEMKALPGESMLEMAKRMMNQRNGANV